MKERNQARQKKVEDVRREQMRKKDAVAIARKNLLEEEKAKQAKVQSEEAAIQQEMIRIRKEMEEERFRLSADQLRLDQC